MSEKSPYWFYAKRYGWGWGLPARSEGWIVLITWIVLIALDGIIVAPRSLLAFYVVFAVMAGIVLVIVYAKGEPPRWRWGKS